MNHLHPSARPYLDLSDEARIERINAECWVGYSRATAILARMEALECRCLLALDPDGNPRAHGGTLRVSA